jgi:O-antigen/teichoic acid export membrane protein
MQKQESWKINSFIIGVGSSVSILSGIIFSVVASRYLSKYDYGTYRQTFLIFDIVSPILLLGLPTSLYHLLTREKHDSKGILIDSLFLLLLGGIMFGLSLLCFKNLLVHYFFENPHLFETLNYLSIYPIFFLPTTLVPVVLVLANKTRTLSIFTITTTFLTTLGSVLVVFILRSSSALVVTRILIAAVVLPPSLILIFNHIKGSWRIPDFLSIKSIIRFSIPIGFATMLGALTMQTHSIIVSFFCTPDQFAVYVNGAIEIPVISVITGSITTVIMSEMSQMCGEKRFVAALDLFRDAALTSAFFLFPTFFFFLIASKQFIVLMYSIEYIKSVVPFVTYLFVIPVRIITYGSALIALGFSREILIRSVFDLIINLILCVFCVYFFGINGAALSLVVSLYLWTVPYNLSLIAKGFKVHWSRLLPFRDLAFVFIKSVASSIAPFCILRYPIFHNDLLNLLLAFLLFIIIYAILNINAIKLRYRTRLKSL